jgi:hypothetical protein
MSRTFRLFVPAVLIAAAVGVAAWSFVAPAKAPAVEPPHLVPVEVPIHFEYKLLAYHPILENMEKELNKLGHDGWEVCGVSSGAVQQVILKRAHR